MAQILQIGEKMNVPRRPQDQDLLKRFGARLCAVRTAGGLTQHRLAEAINMAPKTISLFESGALAPTLTTVALLARALGVRIEELLKADGDPAVACPDGAEEVEALDDFRALSPEHRQAVRVVVRGLAGRTGWPSA